MGWCWAGLVTVAALALSLADSRNLWSPSEQLWEVHLGTWRSFEHLGAGELTWSFAVTPLSAWWGICIGGMMALVGWQSHRNGRPLPFGWIGGVIWLATIGQLFATNLLVHGTLLSVQSLAGALWWAAQSRNPDDTGKLKSFLFTTSIGDVCVQWGVLLAGLAWGTLSLPELSDPDVVQAGWRIRPAWCGSAGLLLFLGVLGRGGMFPFVTGTRIAASSIAPAGALLLSCCLWPGLLWHVVRILPMLGIAPETVAIVQGLSLLAAGVAGFLATGAVDVHRTVGLLATSQIALALSANVVPGMSSPVGLAIVAASIALSTAAIFLRGVNRLARLVAWWTLAGACLSPAFWLSAQAVERFRDWPADSAEVRDIAASDLRGSASSAPNEDSYQVRPLPITTWTAAWCLVTFFGTFAAWRGWRMTSGESLAFFLDSPSLVFCVSLTACGTLSSWLALREEATQFHWSIGAAIGSSLAGGALAGWVCLDRQRTESRFQRFGKWPDLARRELALPEIVVRMNDQFLSPVMRIVAEVEGWLQSGSGRWGADFSRQVVSAGEELRNETDVFYAVALVMTIGTLVVTWWALAG